MPSPEEIAKAFTTHYYNCFDSKNWSMLSGLYTNDSMLTFEGQQFKGTQPIIEKLQSLNTSAVQHKPSTQDCQPCPGGGLVVFVSGDLSIDNGQPIKFAQVFSLFPVPNNPNQFMVINDLFRLNC
mmetsp:Transcript_6208/g.10309  ORF Transcript_6208/g.10309 Transcript_6208/m.10309 type:complete len:125 (+) Transcript_6208:75-449(+)